MILAEKKIKRRLNTFILFSLLLFFYLNFQISLLYSSMVLSDEKNPAFAMLTSIMRFHFASSL